MPSHEATPAHVFVLGADDADLRMLERLPEAQRYRFHSLLHRDELRGVADFCVDELLATATSRLTAHTGAVDAIITLLDFPATELVPILAQRFGTRAPSLEAVLKCNHKYWSRLLQRAVAPDCVPSFAVFSPDPEDVVDVMGLDYPYWVKPLNAFRSHLGFRVDGPDDLRAALEPLRADLWRLAEPLGTIMRQARLPEEIKGLGPHVCLAEGFVGGRQCTLEGFAHRGRAQVYGVVDSIRERNRPSFARYQYPSTLPRRVQDRMRDVAERVMEHIGYDDGCFNMEFYWDRPKDRVWLLEINPRLSHSHCELFEKVDGVSNAQVLVDLALGREPHLPHREGHDRCAANLFIRAFEDGRLRRVPEAHDVARAEAAAPGAHVALGVEAGVSLAALRDQDSYSYELATVTLGAPTQAQLLRRFERVKAELEFEIDRE